MKSVVEKLPGPVAVRLLRSARVTMSRSLNQRLQQREILLEELGRPSRVLSGPFQDMPYRVSPLVPDVLPKLLGTYELEIRPALAIVEQFAPDALINIGAAEGYYAAGLGRRRPGMRLVCFEIHRPTRYLLAHALASNGVADRAEIHGAGTPDSLGPVLQRFARPLILCDCEGSEDVLLDPARLPSLNRAAILVETHEQFAPGSTQRLRERFSASHLIQEFASHPRRDADAPQLPGVSVDCLRACMDEDRAFPQQWFLMMPRGSA